jgi:hypothetical protein
LQSAAERGNVISWRCSVGQREQGAMQKKKSGSGRKRTVRKSASPNEVRLKQGRETTVVYKDIPSSPAPDKRIHPRRALPLVPEGQDRNEDADGQPRPMQADRKDK